MQNQTKLNLIKATHSLIWGVMVIAIFYMLYAAIFNKIGVYLWIALILIVIEIFALVFNKWECPLTSLAKPYLNEWKLGDDIFLPKFIAVYNREIFTPPLVLGVVILLVRLIFFLL